MDVGIVGRPGSGRTTVFRALLANRAPRAAGEKSGSASVGTIQVADPRLTRLAELFKPQKTTPIEIRIHDLCPSLEASFPAGEREAMKRVDALVLVVPGFLDASPDAARRGFEDLLEELCIEDLAAVEKRISRASREPLDDATRSALERAAQVLEASRPVASATFSEVERRALRNYALITDRPLVCAYNAGEDQAGAALPQALEERTAQGGLPTLALCGSLEAEMADLPESERLSFLREYGVERPAGEALARALLARSDLIPFFTVGEDECRAWPIPRGTVARGAAGKIHSDIERGFIRAEVIGYAELEPLGGDLVAAKRAGKLRLEGKDYVVQDGDVVHFRFNV
jgi:ribosome-binding ATPase YchF (GTP1/OBG family)